jgi:amidohydrolase
MVTALQAMVTRRFDVFDPVVVTVGTFHAGTRRNVIPDDATFEATVRTFSPQARERVREYAPRICQDIASAHGAYAEVHYEAEYPVTVNDSAEYDFAASTIREVFGEQRFSELEYPMTGSEDFSRVLGNVPGAFVFLGASRAEDPTSAPTNHSPLAEFDDSVLPEAATVLAELATRRLATSAFASSGRA